MNKKDFQILASLRKDARMPLTKMSRKTGIPVSTIFDRIKSNDNGVIVRYTSLIDFSKLGYNTRANITLSVQREDKEGLQEYLRKHEAVNSLFKINNGFDFMIEVVFKQIKDMEEFLDKIEQRFKIKDKRSFFVIEDIKKEEFMSNDSLLSLDSKDLNT